MNEAPPLQVPPLSLNPTLLPSASLTETTVSNSELQVLIVALQSRKAGSPCRSTMYVLAVPYMDPGRCWSGPALRPWAWVQSGPVAI